MGIPIVETGFNNACPGCFATDKTPLIVYLSVRGVKIGSSWDSSLGDSPNGIWQLGWISACSWRKTINGWTALYQVVGPTSIVRIFRATPPDKFLKLLSFACKTFFANSIVSSSAPFYGGVASVAWVNPKTGSSIGLVAEMAGLENDPEVFAHFEPVSDNINTYRFARLRDGTVVKINFDSSP